MLPYRATLPSHPDLQKTVKFQIMVGMISINWVSVKQHQMTHFLNQKKVYPSIYLHILPYLHIRSVFLKYFKMNKIKLLHFLWNTTKEIFGNHQNGEGGCCLHRGFFQIQCPWVTQMYELSQVKRAKK